MTFPLFLLLLACGAGCFASGCITGVVGAWLWGREMNSQQQDPYRTAIRDINRIARETDRRIVDAALRHMHSPQPPVYRAERDDRTGEWR